MSTKGIFDRYHDHQREKQDGGPPRAAWPEDPVPPGCIPCLTCSLACQGSRVIWGEGNPEADIWILLDNPGMREDRTGRPFVCGTRQTLHAAAKAFGYSDRDLYVTFVVRRRPVRAYPKDEERSRCVQNLFEQISAARPRILFCMGDVALSAVLGQESHVREMRGRGHRWRDRILLVTYHPLAVRRRPNLAPHWEHDWALLREQDAQGRV